MAGAFCISAGNGLVREHAHVRDVEHPLVRGKRDGEGKPAHRDTAEGLTAVHVEDHDAKIGLVHGIKKASRRVQREVCGVTVLIAALVHFEYVQGAAGGGVKGADLAGFAFGGVKGVLIGEGEAHEGAVPVVRVIVVRLFAQNSALTDFPCIAGLFEEGEREVIGSAIGGDDAVAGGAEGEAEGTGTGGEFGSERGEQATAGEHCTGARFGATRGERASGRAVVCCLDGQTGKQDGNRE